MVQEQDRVNTNNLDESLRSPPDRSSEDAVETCFKGKDLQHCGDSEVGVNDEPPKTALHAKVLGVGSCSPVEVTDEPANSVMPLKVLGANADPQTEASDEATKPWVRPKALGISDDGDCDRAYRQGNWVLSSIVILLKAKRKEVEMSAGCKRFLSADEKWKYIEDYCRKHGVQRTKEQCKIKWDNMQPDYRKIKAYEEHRDNNTPSYFDMGPSERRLKLLPSNMDQGVYRMIADIHSNKPSRGGSLKKEAREKKFHDSPMVVAGNGVAEGSHCNDEVKNMHMPSFVGKHTVSPPTRALKKRAVKKSIESRHGECESSNGSSTEEDDAYVIASRTQPLLASQMNAKNEIHSQMLCLENRDTSLLSMHAKTELPLRMLGLEKRDTSPLSLHAKNEVPVLRLGLESSRDTSPISVHHKTEAPVLRLGLEGRVTSPILHKDVATGQYITDRNNQDGSFEAKGERFATMQGASESNGDGAFEAKGERPAVMQRPSRSMDDYEMQSYAQDREDARHKEILALEKEKLAVFKEASTAIVNAMNNAVFMFSKIAEELLLRWH